jgi:hypothetical protein
MLKEVTKEIGITQRHWHFVTNETWPFHEEVAEEEFKELT